MNINDKNQALPDDLYDDEFLDDDSGDEAFEDDDSDDPLDEAQARRLLEQPPMLGRKPGRFAPTQTQRIASAAELIARAEERKNAAPPPKPLSPRQREREALREKALAYRPPKEEQEGVRVPALLYNVSQLLRELEGATRDYDVDGVDLPLTLPDDPDPAIARDVRGHLRLTRVRKEVLAQGTFTAIVGTTCSRCLEPATLPVEAVIEEQFKPSNDVITGLPIYYDTAEDEADLKIDQNHLLNLGEALRQQILVSLPLKPLHAPDCKGLCPQCGQNLNDGDCNCIEDTIDPRWSALTNLKLPNNGG